MGGIDVIGAVEGLGPVIIDLSSRTMVYVCMYLRKRPRYRHVTVTVHTRHE